MLPVNTELVIATHHNNLDCLDEKQVHQAYKNIILKNKNAPTGVFKG